jgi:DNA-binding IclR family transcriptional regulator
MQDELEPSLASLAVPVPAAGSGGAPLALIGVSGPTGRLDAGRRRALVPALRATAERLAASRRTYR